MVATPVHSVRQLQIDSPLGPVFPGLLRECASEIADYLPYFGRTIQITMWLPAIHLLCESERQPVLGGEQHYTL
jgi:hypothetical protein